MKFNFSLNKIKSILIVLLLQSLLIFSQKKDNKSPNIIIFLVDDMGLMDTSLPFLTDAKGNLTKYPLNDFYRTPNMEKLAKQGVRFTNFYAHSVCSPTRASILTGQNSARHRTTNWVSSERNNRTKFGPLNWNWNGLTKNDITLPKILQSEGYKTIHVGKAHFGPFGSDGENPLNLGFDVNIAGSSIGQPGSYYGTDGFGHIKGNKKRAVDGLEKYHSKDIFLTEALTLEANEEISKTVKNNKPFFLYMAHYAVHSPFQSDSRFADNYKKSGKNKRAQAYATLIEGIDKSLGDIVAHIKKLGVGENTLILFLGDNGSDAPLKKVDNYSSSSPLKGKKGNHWEGGMRVPFIASWVTPNKKEKHQKKTFIKSGAIQNQVGTILDIFPTISKIAKIDYPNNYVLDGFILQKQFKGKKSCKRNEIFLNHFPHGNHRSNYYSSLVVSDWKVIYHYQVKDSPKYELFHLKSDPFETNNLADKNPKKLKSMMKMLIKDLNNKKALYPEKDNKQLKIMMPI